MAPGLRSQIQSHIQSHSQYTPTSQSGGRTKRKHKAKSNRRKKNRGGSCCSSKKTSSMMGGMGLGPIIKQALVPFGLFAMQKRTHKAKSHGKRKTYRRR
jgi:hypothetical protein